MLVESITLNASQLREELLQRLIERVFHVTTDVAYNQIMEDGVIKTNFDGSLTPTPRFENAYFRSRNCVSLCDLRGLTDEQIAIGLDAYYFLNPQHRDASPVFLFLSGEAEDELIPGSRWRDERAFEKLLAPHVEAGYPGDLSITMVDEVLKVAVIRPPPDDHLQAMIKYGGPPRSDV